MLGKHIYKVLPKYATLGALKLVKIAKRDGIEVYRLQLCHVDPYLRDVPNTMLEGILSFGKPQPGGVPQLAFRRMGEYEQSVGPLEQIRSKTLPTMVTWS